MSKEQLKTSLGASGDLALIDTDRLTPKAEGGTYTTENTRILEPRTHMERHGILREREEDLATMKSAFDDREQTMKVTFKIQNQLLAYQRGVDDEDTETAQFLAYLIGVSEDRLQTTSKRLDVLIKEYAKTDALAKAALGVAGIGPLTVAAMTVYVDLEKAQCASSLWSYTGLDKASHERYEKGTAGGGNKTLRTILYRMSDVQIKNPGGNCPYRIVYDRTKERLSQSAKIVKSRNTQGKLIECEWRETKPCHRDGAARRAIMKHFLADYWFVGRTILGLPTRPLYVVEKLGHTGVVQPQERGWIW